MTNFLDSVLTDPQYYFWVGSKNSGPSYVDGSFSEVFSFNGEFDYCSFLCSFAISRVLRFSCIVQIANCLSVPLSNRKIWCCNSEDNNVLPLEILPLHRESLFVSGETNLEAIFSYGIISTDLALVIALKVGSGGKSFAAAFVPSPTVTGKKELEALMDGNQWKSQDYRKNSNASEGMQLIGIRNIRAEILTTEEEKSVLKIRIFAV
ncbi:unnamed protein product [Allacma fusca]|uniref:Uncharacterized protein n=1 Tax=Allacma fusca TaxID=39272 RepID=A0A8J2PEJ5_9HEXA|nr:unnamed protein product [Allacma fusca]